MIQVPADKTGHPLINRGCRLKAQLFPGPIDVGKGGRDVSKLDGQKLLLGFDVQFPFQEADNLLRFVGLKKLFQAGE